MIARNPVKSTNVRAIGYDEATRTLAVEFQNGGIYHYSDVSPETHAELMKAKSPGSYLHSIKGNYEFQKQEEEDANHQ